MKLLYGYLMAVTVFLAGGGTASAQSTYGDMWTQQAEKSGLFSPHVNNCDSSTEVFIAVDAGSTLGYCIEKNERSAAIWVNAKATCASVGKRLPEPAEFSYACKNPPGGLSNMTGNGEWVSNNAIPLYGASAADYIAVPHMGYDGCARGGYGAVATNFHPNGSEDSLAFRCVR